MNDFYQVSLKLILKNKNGEILGLKSLPHGSMQGKYDFPGGRIDVNEFSVSFADIIKREICEEVGDISFIFHEKPIAVARHLIPGYIRKSSHEDLHLLYLFFEADYASGNISISSEHESYQWINLSKITLEDYFTSGILDGVRMYLKR